MLSFLNLILLLFLATSAFTGQYREYPNITVQLLAQLLFLSQQAVNSARIVLPNEVHFASSDMICMKYS